MLLSIIIPNYNYEKFIISTLISIENQDYANIEVVIVDDGSTDSSIYIIEDFISKSKLNIILVKTQNCGQASAINTGIANSSGEVIGWINSDDTYSENIFGIVMSKFIANRNLEIIYGDINVIDLFDNYLFTLKHRKFSYLFSVFYGFSNCLSSNAFFWKRHLHIERKTLNPEFKCGLDNDFFSRLTFKANMYQIKIPLANFRQQPFSKAALASNDWNNLMKIEKEKVFTDSYNNLSMSKLISASFAMKLIPFFVFWRRIEKVFSMYYFRILFNFISR